MEKYAKLKFTFIAILVALWFYFFWASGIPLGPDLKGGFELLYRLQLREGTKPSAKQIDETIEVIQNRIDTVGLKEIRVQSYGSEHIIVNLPGGSEAEKEQVKAVVERMGVLYFELIAKSDAASPDPYRFPEDEIKKVKEAQLEIERQNRERAEKGELLIIPPKRVVPFVQRDKEGKETGRFETIVETADRVSGGLLSDIYATQNNLGQPAVGFKFNSEGANQFKNLTREENVGRYLAIVLDDVVQSAPVLKTTISGSGIIEGRFTRDEVRQQIIILKSGSLPTKPALDREFSVGPMLGERAIKRGITAIVIGIILVLLIMGIYYLSAGMISNLALIINVILIVGSLSASAATFTLPGFAGLILTIGMAVDANILIFERIREEKAKGKSLRQATETGFSRAFWTIFDANITTLLTALILLWAGTGPIRGFAVTLSIGIVCSMFAALFVTRAILGFLIDKRVLKDLKMLQILKNPSMGFVKARHVAFTISMIAIVAGLFLFFSRGDEKYGIDFTGGSLFQINLRKPETISKVKETVQKVEGLENAIVVATYLNFPGEQPDKGIAMSFTIRTRTVETAEVEEETGRTRQFQEVLHQRIKEAFKDMLAPQALDTSTEVVEEQQKFEVDEKKAVAYVYVRKGKDDDPGKLARTAAEVLNNAKEFRGTAVTVAQKEGEASGNFVRLRAETEETDFALTPLKQVVANIGSVLEKDKSVNLSDPFPRVDTIGASVAYNLKSKAVVALTLAMFGIIIYIAVRFELKFGFAAVFALGHDVAIALGAVTLVDMLGLVDMKIDLPTTAAFLTIIGYSLNDTIVVFDRIRENMRRRDFDAKKSKESYTEIINDSINETISRTLLTSFTTFIVVLVLFLSGVEAIAGFTFAMLVGVVIGTYSSIFIASPILIFMRPAEVKKK